MEREIIESLKKERDRRLNTAAQKLLKDDDLEGAERDLNWVNTSLKLLSSTEQSRKIRWMIFIALLCVVIIGLSWTLRIRTTHVSIRLETENIRLVLGENWSPNFEFAFDKVFINKVVNLTAPGLQLPTKLTSKEEPAIISLDGKEIRLTQLEFPVNSNIELNGTDNELNFFIKYSSLSGDIEVMEADLAIEGEDTKPKKISIDSEPPESINFKTANVKEAPILLTFVTQDDWRLDNINAHDIDFSEENPPGSGNFESSIRSGKVTILETGLTRELLGKDHLIIKKPTSKRLEITEGENGFKVFFEGSVREIHAGPKDFEEDLEPTLFEYIYHKEPLFILWGAVVFLFGLIWRIYSVIFP